jgi:hypothetical protein
MQFSWCILKNSLRNAMRRALISNIGTVATDPSVRGTECKTDKSKRKEVCFGRKVLTDKKSGRFFLGPFLIQPIILFLFVLIFLLSEWICSENAVGGSWAGQICPFLTKNSM